MSDDVPSDVAAVLTQLLDGTETAIETAEFETARQAIATAATVSRNKLPAGELRGQLLHGCTELTAALDSDSGVEPEIAVAYVRAMARRLP